MESCLVLTSLLLFCLAQTCYGNVFFSSLPRTLVVSASPRHGQVLNAGEDSITLTWGLNQSIAADAEKLYKDVKVKLCYAPISQEDRTWRKTDDKLTKDKTCQFIIVHKPYGESQNFEWMIERNVPTAIYFVRVYAYDSAGEEVGYGQTTDAKKTSNLFKVQGISGRHLSLDVASVCFSVFCVVSLIGFFLVEKNRNRKSTKN